MTPERATAYARVKTFVEDLAPAKLHLTEQTTIREAADALLFSTDVATDPEARVALERLDALVDRLLAADRLMPETAESLLAAVEACGPRPISA